MTARHRFRTAAILAAYLILPLVVIGQRRQIDVQHSVVTVHVYKSGVFSAFGHDHEIAAPIAGGSVDTAGHHVEWHATAASLRVRDPNASAKDRGEIQKTMLGPEVLDVEHHSEIIFRSTAAEQTGADSWSVHGDLTLHGQTRPIAVDVTEKAGHYAGTARLKQTDFGIAPIKIAGGAVRVKDEVRVDFDIQLAR
jgi:polyisoprenoid-binding protein YceI